VDGFRETETSAGGLMVSWANAVPFNVAVTWAVVGEPTATVVTVKLAEVAPPRTFTAPGTDAAALSLASATEMPPEGAGPFNVTVPAEEFGPVTLVGFRETERIAGGLTVKGADAVPLKAAVMFGVTVDVTAVVVTVKLAIIAPWGTITELGTVATALSLASATEMPPEGAGEFNVTVPVEEFPPTKLAGLNVSEVAPLLPVGVNRTSRK
jgi:hypothetical protein